MLNKLNSWFSHIFFIIVDFIWASKIFIKAGHPFFPAKVYHLETWLGGLFSRMKMVARIEMEEGFVEQSVIDEIVDKYSTNDVFVHYAYDPRPYLDKKGINYEMTDLQTNQAVEKSHDG